MKVRNQGAFPSVNALLAQRSKVQSGTTTRRFAPKGGKLAGTAVTEKPIMQTHSDAIDGAHDFDFAEVMREEISELPLCDSRDLTACHHQSSLHEAKDDSQTQPQLQQKAHSVTFGGNTIHEFHTPLLQRSVHSKNVLKHPTNVAQGRPKSNSSAESLLPERKRQSKPEGLVSSPSKRSRRTIAVTKNNSATILPVSFGLQTPFTQHTVYLKKTEKVAPFFMIMILPNDHSN